MKELRIVEIVSKISILAVTSCQACEPVICHEDTWFNLLGAAIFQASFVKHSNLEHDMSSSIALIRCWENVSIMKEHNSHSSLKALMNCDLYRLVLNLNFDVGF